MCVSSPSFLFFQLHTECLMSLFLLEPWEIRKDHQDPGNRLTKSPAYLIRDYSFDVWVDFDACFLSGYSWVTFCILNNFLAFMNVKDPQGLNVLVWLNYSHFLSLVLNSFWLGKIEILDLL